MKHIQYVDLCSRDRYIQTETEKDTETEGER